MAQKLLFKKLIVKTKMLSSIKRWGKRLSSRRFQPEGGTRRDLLLALWNVEKSRWQLYYWPRSVSGIILRYSSTEAFPWCRCMTGTASGGWSPGTRAPLARAPLVKDPWVRATATTRRLRPGPPGAIVVADIWNRRGVRYLFTLHCRSAADVKSKVLQYVCSFVYVSLLHLQGIVISEDRCIAECCKWT